MSDLFKKLLRYLFAYIAFWFAMTQINSFAAMASVYLPVFWVFVYFPGMRYDWRPGLLITVLSALFLESQYPETRGIFLPLMIVLFLLLHVRRSRAVDSKTGTQIAIASAVHWILILIPTAVMQLFHVSFEGQNLWARTLQDGVTGQMFLLLIFPVLSVGSVLLEGRDMGDEGSVSA